ncbi:caspase family protein [Methyloceanibacter sp.]|uniref:caspase family protein n=1 Tax=Methyloceanibacter sp. TaxID=1965321 RepID=UPI003D6CA054
MTMTHLLSRIVAPVCLSLLGIGLLVPFAVAERQASGKAAPMVSTVHSQETAKVVPTVNVGHSGFVKDVVFSPDGRWLASLASDETVKLWEVTTGRLLRTIAPGIPYISDLRITADSKFVVIYVEDTIYLFDAASGTATRKIALPSYELSPTRYGVTSQGDLITVRYFQNYQHIDRWQIATGRSLGQVAKDRITGRNIAGLSFFSPLTMSISADDRWIVLGYGKHYQRAIARVELVEAATGRLKKVFDSHVDDVTAAVVSPDGRMLGSSSRDGTIKLWDVADGRLLRTLTGHVGEVRIVAFSPDGRRLASGGEDKTLKVWDVANGSLLNSVATETAVDTAAYSPDGTLIAFNDDQTVELRSAETLNPVRVFGSGNDDVIIVPAPRDRLIISSNGGRWVRSWDATNGQPIESFVQGETKLGDLVPSVGSDQGGPWLLGFNNDNKLKLWDVASPTPTIPSALVDVIVGGHGYAIAPNGRLVAATVFSRNKSEKKIRVWDAASGKVLWTFDTPWDIVLDPLFSPDSRFLTAMVNESDDDLRMALKMWDVTSGRLIKSVVDTSDNTPSDIVYLQDLKSFVGWGWDGLKVYNAAGRASWQASQMGLKYETAAISPDHRWLAAAASDTTVSIRNVSDGQDIRQLAGNPGVGKSILFFQNGRRLAVGNSDGTSAIWSTETDQLLATTVHGTSGEWVTITPEGFFTASEKGAELLHVVEGFGTIGIDQVYQSLYRPDLVQEKLAGDPDGKVKEAAAKLDLDKVIGSGAAPKVSIVSPMDRSTADGDEVAVEASVADQGGGVGKVEWRVNGTTLGVDERGLSRVEAEPAAPASAASGSATAIKRTLSLEPGENHIELIAYNEKNLIASEPAKVTVNWDGDTGATLPKLYVLAVAVNDYWDGRLKLTYAVPDADALAEAFRQSGAGTLYSSVEVRKVEDADVTIANLDKVFGALAGEAHARDAFVFFLAGHGKTIDGRYYYVPQDFRYEGEQSIVDKGIDQDRLQAWFAQIPARRSVLLFDTCESGTLTGEKVAQRGLERVAALDRMTQAMGRTVLSASTEDAPALEGYRGHGVFTYAVLDALGAADTSGNGTIEVTELASFVDQKVPELSYEAFKQRQVPQMKIVGSNFTLSNKVLVAAKDQAPIDAVQSKPTHVVIVPADVFATAGGEGSAVSKLAPGSLVALVRTEQGWVLVAKDGKSLGYVANTSLAPIQ